MILYKSKNHTVQKMLAEASPDQQSSAQTKFKESEDNK